MVDVAQIMGIVTTIIWVLVGLAIAGGILWYVFYWSKYNTAVIVRDETSGGNIIRDDTAREMYDDKNILVWKIRKEKITVPCPPKSAISIKKGKKFAELVRVQGDQYHWLDVSKFKENAERDAGEFFVIAEDAKRQLADQIQKAEQERLSKGNAMLQQIIPFIAIGILLIGAYFIYDAVGSNMSEMADKFGAISGQNAQIAEQNAKILASMENLVDKNNDNANPAQNIVIPQKAPN